jgi:hypothetical protein
MRFMMLIADSQNNVIEHCSLLQIASALTAFALGMFMLGPDGLRFSGSCLSSDSGK